MSSTGIPTDVAMDDFANDELQAARRPLESLISKSEKALQKLASETWQYKMLRHNLKALYIASALMNKNTNEVEKLTRDDFQDSLHAFADMISRTEKALAKFAPGTSQHTLQSNRLKALRIAEAMMRAEVDNGNV